MGSLISIQFCLGDMKRNFTDQPCELDIQDSQICSSPSINSLYASFFNNQTLLGYIWPDIRWASETSFVVRDQQLYSDSCVSWSYVLMK